MIVLSVSNLISETLDFYPSWNADVCIVGAGPVGIALALECERLGLSSILLEAGEAEHNGQGTVIQKQSYLTSTHHAAIDTVRFQGLGGTSRLWGGRCVPLDDIDFELRDQVRFSGWPISHSDIKNYYDKALLLLGYNESHKPNRNLTVPHIEGIETNNIEYWSAMPDIGRLHFASLSSSKKILLQTGCSVTGIQFNNDGSRTTALDVVSRDGHRSHVSANSYVLAAGGLETTRLLLGAQRDWPGKFGGSDGALGRFYAGHLTGYVAAIRFDDPKFAKAMNFQRTGNGSVYRYRLALSRETQAINGLLNTAFWLDSFSISDPAHQSGALSLLYLTLSGLGLYSRLSTGRSPAPTASQLGDERLHKLNIQEDPTVVRATVHVLWQLLRKRRLARAFALENPANRYLLRYHAEHAPSPDSRVRLIDGQTNSSKGGLTVDLKVDARDVDSVVRSHAVLADRLERHKVGRLEYLMDDGDIHKSVLDQARDGYHQTGLTRMSECPSTGVVDRNCRVHCTDNLFVVGSSVFPTAGQANPTLPAVALALRLGTYLAARTTISN